MKASTTIYRLVLSFLSQFFRVGGTFPARRKTAHHPHPKVCRCVTTSTAAPQPCTAPKGVPRPPALHLVAGPHRQSPSPVGNVGGSHVYRMGQSLRVHREVTLDSRHLLARAIALVPSGVRVLDTLGVARCRSWSALSVHCFVGPRQPIFFRTCSRMESCWARPLAPLPEILVASGQLEKSASRHWPYSTPQPSTWSGVTPRRQNTGELGTGMGETWIIVST